MHFGVVPLFGTHRAGPCAAGRAGHGAPKFNLKLAKDDVTSGSVRAARGRGLRSLRGGSKFILYFVVVRGSESTQADTRGYLKAILNVGRGWSDGSKVIKSTNCSSGASEFNSL